MMPRKKCIICEGEIYRGKARGSPKLRRADTGVTCSKECARVYRRVNVYLNNKYLNKMIKLKNKIKQLKNY